MKINNAGFYILLLILISGCPTLGQDARNWLTLAPNAEEFQVEVPVVNSPESFKDKSAAPEKDDSFRYRIVTGGTYLFIFSDSLTAPDQFQTRTVLGFARELKAEGIGTVVSGFKGEKFKFTDEDGFYHTIILVKTKHRSYAFQTVSTRENDLFADRFFASIKLSDKRNDAAKTGSDDKKTYSAAQGNKVTALERRAENNLNNKVMSPPAPGNASSGGIGTGLGGESSTVNSRQQTPSKQSAPLTILSKPRPSYTDYARFYQISGKILVRVSFMASGEVGTVMPLNKLPFGITEEAVKAAKAIKFNPLIKEGIPISVSKIVEYSFTIY